MKAPRFFLGCMMVFWGWQHELLLISICLGLILESSYFHAFRLEFKASDFNKFVDVSIVFLAGTIVIALSTDAQKAMYILMKWIPVIFFPIMMSQQLSTQGKIDVQAFFLAGRKRLNMQVSELKKIDISYIYALVCLLSSGMTKQHEQQFFIGVSLFFMWALWHTRPVRFKVYIWGLCILAVFFSGYFSHKGILEARTKISRWMMAYWMDYYSADPFKTSTALGDIGELKLSDRIVLRVSVPGDAVKQPFLLQNATYNAFLGSNWYSRSVFEPVKSKKEDTFWQIQPPVKQLPGKQLKEMTIYSRLFKNKAVLYLPAGVTSIAQMKVGACEKNTMQSVRIEDGPSLIKTVVKYTGGLSYDPEPGQRDLLINKKELDGLLKIVELLELENKPPKEVLKVLKSYFSTQYTYSLDLEGRGEYATPVQNFLYHTKAGHCELFATSTALILRAVNIPSRYTTGFIVHEYSKLENRLLVRQRDAHAWVKVFIDGKWENFDTTPAISLQADMERSDPSLFLDALSFIGFKFSQLRHETGAKLMEEYGFWLVLPLAVILFFRLKKANTIKRAKQKDESIKKEVLDSHQALFYRIEKILLKKGYPKYPHETYFIWFNRISYCFKDPAVKARFLSVISQYHKWRFSRSGLKGSEKDRFDSDINYIIEKISAFS